jgi:DNA repair proteins
VSFEVEEVLRGAVRRNLRYHTFSQHPSGRNGVAGGDVHATRRLVDAAEPLAIEVLDHIVPDYSPVSMLESAYLGSYPSGSL